MSFAEIILQICICFGASLILSWVFVLTRHYHSSITADNSNGPQKIHLGDVPRVGGLAIFISVVIGSLYLAIDGFNLLLILICAATPAFLSGIIEDITKSISPVVRLLASLISGILFIALTGVSLQKTSVPFIDAILQIEAIAVFVTIMAIATMVNATNITDGLNGLSLGTSLMIVTIIALIALGQNDTDILVACLIMVSAIAGLFIVNFPFGRIFLGDGGAYLLGALIAMMTILLATRNAGISPFTCLLIILYPLVELMRSMIRRMMSSTSKGVLQPDHEHLHSLMYRYMKKVNKLPLNNNAMAACLTLLMPFSTSVAAYFFYNQPVILIISCIAFVLAYETTLRTLRRKLAQ